MHYTELENRLKRLVRGASPAARHRFCVETISLLRQRAADALIADLSSAEREVFVSILDGLESGQPEELMCSFDAFHGGLCSDDVRAIEFQPDLVELFCVVDSYIRYRQSGETSHVLHIAIFGINSADYLADAQGFDCSVDDILGSPVMVAEYERQQRLLTGV